jgi:hypothetical protein
MAPVVSRSKPGILLPRLADASQRTRRHVCRVAGSVAVADVSIDYDVALAGLAAIVCGADGKAASAWIRTRPVDLHCRQPPGPDRLATGLELLSTHLPCFSLWFTFIHNFLWLKFCRKCYRREDCGVEKL